MSTAQIAYLNDQFRRGLIGGRVMITQGVQALGVPAMEAIIRKVREFDTFSEDHDPYGEHDLGSVSYEGETIFWKIDYYDQKMEFGSHDPTDPRATTRVMTVMLASEY